MSSLYRSDTSKTPHIRGVKKILKLAHIVRYGVKIETSTASSKVFAHRPARVHLDRVDDHHRCSGHIGDFGPTGLQRNAAAMAPRQRDTCAYLQPAACPLGSNQILSKNRGVFKRQRDQLRQFDRLGLRLDSVCRRWSHPVCCRHGRACALRDIGTLRYCDFGQFKQCAKLAIFAQWLDGVSGNNLHCDAQWSDSSHQSQQSGRFDRWPHQRGHRGTLNSRTV